MYGMHGVAEHRLRAAALDEPARVHDVDVVTEGGREAEVVRDQDHPHAALLDDPGQHVHDPRLRRHVERRRRLVRDQHVRIRADRHRDHDALAHAARELVRIVVGSALRLRDADVSEQLDGPGARLPAADLIVGEDRLDDLVADGLQRVERRHRILVDEREPPPRTEAISRSERAVSSRPRRCTSPAAIRTRGGSSRISDSAVSDLPLPDSPTIPTR